MQSSHAYLCSEPCPNVIHECSHLQKLLLSVIWDRMLPQTDNYIKGHKLQYVINYRSENEQRVKGM
jgi:hypothetical protein